MIAELITLAVIALALVFKFMHYPGANVLLVVSLSTLAMVYTFGGFSVLKAKYGQKGAGFLLLDHHVPEQKRSALAIIAGMGFGITCMGILFRFLYWPGGKAMLTPAALGLPILLAVLFYLKGKEDQSAEKEKGLLIRLVVFSILAISFYMVSNKNLLTIQYPNDPEVVRIKSNYFDHPENEAYKREYEEYRNSDLKR